MKNKLVFFALATLPLALAVIVDAQTGVPGTPPANQNPPLAKPANQAPPKVKTPVLPKPPKPAWEEFKLNPKTTMFLDFTESNPDMVISIFSRTSGITIIKDPSFKTNLTVTSAKAVPLKEAFEIFNTVLNLNGYELQKRGNLMLVGRKMPPPQPGQPAPPPPPQPVVKTYHLDNANAAQVARVINDVFAQGGPTPGGGGGPQPGIISFGPGGPIIPGAQAAPGGPGGAAKVKATSEDYSNSVVVIAMPADHTTVEKIIADLDKPTSNPLVSEMFPLKYVPAEEMLSVIEDILTSNTPTGRGAGQRNNNNQGGFFFGGFSPFGNSRQRQAGGQSATAVKQTNSVIVNATKENIELIRKLVQNMDQPGSFVGTTFVIRLENAKASDVADLLSKSFAQRTDNNNNGGFFFFSDFLDPNRDRNKQATDIDENGQIVNVRDIVGKVTITADPNTNSLIIVTQPSNMLMIRQVVDKLDHIAEQVMIETVIVEANLDKTTKLGVEWTFNQTKLFNDPKFSGSGSTIFGLQNSTTPLDGLRYTITHQDYKAFLNLVANDTRFKVLDTPKIFTSNNVKAEINVSQKLPYITSQQTGIGGNLLTTYTFQDVGVILTVTPRITSSGQVTMEVVQSADDLQGFTDFNAPIINHRQASTTVSVNDGETIVLGGIIRHTVNDSTSKIPLLGDIPLFGNLFKSTKKTAGQTELMVFLTPRIVRSRADAAKVRSDEIKKLSPDSQKNIQGHVPPP